MRETSFYINHVWLLCTVVFGTYSQAIVRWRLLGKEDMPDNLSDKLVFTLYFLLDPYVISAIIATFIAGVCWIISLSKFDLNYAYPWMSLIFLFTLLSGHFVLGESLSIGKAIGTVMIVGGLTIIVRS